MSVINEIFKLDLQMIGVKLQERSAGWTKLQCEGTEAEYKRFLCLKKLYPAKDFVPNEWIERFWHQHILDTVKYHHDCMRIFGYFVHHYPYFGMNGNSDACSHADAFHETCSLYEAHFGESYLGSSGRCNPQAGISR